MTIQDVNQALADSFKLSRPYGALVSQVENGGPGDKAGLKAGDVILAVDGRSVERSGELPAVIAGIKPGTDATLEIWRDKAKRKRPDQDRRARGRHRGRDRGYRREIRMRAGSASPCGRFPATSASSCTRRAAWWSRKSGGPAEEAGVEPGDVVLAVNGAPVAIINDFRNSVNKSGGTVALLIQRGDAQIYIPVRTGS